MYDYLISLRLNFYLFILTCTFLLHIPGCTLEQDQQQTSLFDLTSKWDTTRSLENPHKGWFHHYYDNGDYKYGLTEEEDDYLFEKAPGMDHIYIRLAWAFFEPEDDEYDWSYIDEVIDKYYSKVEDKAKKKKIALLVSCKETSPLGSMPDGKHAVPKWLVDLGAKGEYVDCWGNIVWEPDYDDPVFLEKLEEFHRAMGARYDGKPYLAYIDIGSYGTWGEGHNSPASFYVASTEIVKKHIDIYERCYPESQLTIAINYASGDDKYSQDQKDEIKAYVNSRNIGWRDNGKCIFGWYLENWPETYGYPAPDIMEGYANAPATLEFHHYHMVVDNDLGWSEPNGLDKGLKDVRGGMTILHPTYMGYHGYLKRWYENNPKTHAALLNEMGYWYFIKNVEVPRKILPGEEAEIKITWVNEGVAPAYNRYAVLFKLVDETSQYVVGLEDSGNLHWMDHETNSVTYRIAIPESYEGGDYDLKVKLMDKLDTGRDIDLGLNT